MARSAMPSTSHMYRDSLQEDNFGLNDIAEHDTATFGGHYPFSQHEPQNMNLSNGYSTYLNSSSYADDLPSPRSNAISEGIRTRSGRSARRSDSPYGSAVSGISKSPLMKARKKKSKLDKSRTPKLTAPLSVLTKDMTTPLKDINQWVNRSIEVRREEVEKRKGYVTRPMNSFMLYRSAYAERTKQWCLQNNHQVVSSVSGESWPMEPQDVRDRFNEWAKIERAHHQAAHPDYKFSPSKAANKRPKDEYSENDAHGSDLDGDPDGEYHGPRRTRSKRQARQEPPRAQPVSTPESHPYFNQGFEDTQFQSGQTARPRAVEVSSSPHLNTMSSSPANLAFHHHGRSEYAYSGEYDRARSFHPDSCLPPQQSIGGYGLPGGEQILADDFGLSSRTPHSANHYTQHDQHVFQQYPAPSVQQAYPSLYPAASSQQLFDQGPYMQMQSQPETGIDPALENYDDMHAMGFFSGHNSHYENTMGDMVEDMSRISEYFEDPTCHDPSLAPAWGSADL